MADPNEFNAAHIVRGLTPDQLLELINKTPSPSIAHSLGNALWKEGGEVRGLLAALVESRTDLLYYLRFDREYAPEQMAAVLNWCEVQASRLLASGGTDIDDLEGRADG